MQIVSRWTHRFGETKFKTATWKQMTSEDDTDNALPSADIASMIMFGKFRLK